MIRFRRWLAHKLAFWARHIYPDSEEVMRFHEDRLIEMMLHGHSSIKITAVPEHEWTVDPIGGHAAVTPEDIAAGWPVKRSDAARERSSKEGK